MTFRDIEQLLLKKAENLEDIPEFIEVSRADFDSLHDSLKYRQFYPTPDHGYVSIVLYTQLTKVEIRRKLTPLEELL